MDGVKVGVDFGGTTIEAGVVWQGRVLSRADIPTRAGQPAEVILDALARLVESLERRPTAVGLAIPGEVDEHGRCRRLPNVPGFEGISIAARLIDRLRCPVAVENDATAAALGELRHGRGRERASFLLLTLGTGVGGGLALGGRLHRGRHGFGGEVGHVQVDSSAEAWPCPCGLRGCMESVAGTVGILRSYREAGGAADRSIAEIAGAARAGEPAALSAFAAMGRALGMGLALIQNALDLDAVLFTGGVAGALDLVEPSIREGMRSRAYDPLLADVPLLPGSLGRDAGIVGAAELVAERAAGLP